MTLTKTEIYEEVERLRAIAIRKAAAAHEDILSNKYEWELGADIYRMITEDIPMYLDDSISKFKLLGYPVRINLYDKEIIKLWKEVEAWTI